MFAISCKLLTSTNVWRREHRHSHVWKCISFLSNQIPSPKNRHSIWSTQVLANLQKLSQTPYAHVYYGLLGFGKYVDAALDAPGVSCCTLFFCSAELYFFHQSRLKLCMYNVIRNIFLLFGPHLYIGIQLYINWMGIYYFKIYRIATRLLMFQFLPWRTFCFGNFIL